MEKNKKNLVILIILLSIFFFVIALLAISFLFVMRGATTSGIIYFFVKYHIQLMIFLGLLGVGVGVSSYLSFRSQQQTVKETHQSASAILFRFLDQKEQVVIQTVLQKETTQAELSRKLGKVQTYRTLQKLQEKQLITLEEKGKTKEVRLMQEIRDLLSTDANNPTTHL
jgi:uncharacterized membrane protein